MRGVSAIVCKPLLSVDDHTSKGGYAVMHGDEGYLFHKGSPAAEEVDAWVQDEARASQRYGCTVGILIKQRLQHLRAAGQKYD